MGLAGGILPRFRGQTQRRENAPGEFHGEAEASAVAKPVEVLAGAEREELQRLRRGASDHTGDVDWIHDRSAPMRVNTLGRMVVSAGQAGAPQLTSPCNW